MAIVGFIIGAILGSLVKALADRSLNYRSFLGRSYCPKCIHKLRWYDLTPIVSYLILRGKCRYCEDKISLEYLLVEVGMGILVGFLFWQSFNNFQFVFQTAFGRTIFNPFSIFIAELLFNTFFITVLAILFLTDIKKMLIPDRIVIPAIWIGITFITVITAIKIIFLYYYLSQTLLGQKLLEQTDYFQRHALITAEPLLGSILMAAAIGGFFMALIILTKGKGMGGGDVKLGALIGLGLGFPHGLVALMLSFLSGATVSLVLILMGKKHFGQNIPFGPFLVLGSLMALFWGPQIVNWYLQIGT